MEKVKVILWPNLEAFRGVWGFHDLLQNESGHKTDCCNMVSEIWLEDQRAIWRPFPAAAIYSWATSLPGSARLLLKLWNRGGLVNEAVTSCSEAFNIVYQIRMVFPLIKTQSAPFKIIWQFLTPSWYHLTSDDRMPKFQIGPQLWNSRIIQNMRILEWWKCEDSWLVRSVKILNIKILVMSKTKRFRIGQGPKKSGRV